ncbi:viral A-type inclusion protein [Reticulomyxa filosa]|uniref:Viral A-type inclusion protein n=1 Tax=Reticulomyxa filosa TaxID=46433 RepID=X6M5Y3_RETFI|nr:viral A-type inclusion protein [Reticulomyxa filosa]|eukprot:ETO08435.1 viral A-type inclusion protein [Reticulomyxa filosa]
MLRGGYSSTKNETANTSSFQSCDSMLETLKREVQKWKNKYDLTCKHKQEVEDRCSKNALETEEWKAQAKSLELELKHYTKKHEHEMKELQLTYQREHQKTTSNYEQQIDDLTSKLIKNESLLKHLEFKRNFNKKVNKEKNSKNTGWSNYNKTNELDICRESLSKSEEYQKSLENKLEMSVQQAIEIQQSISERMDSTQKALQEGKSECMRQLERVKTQLQQKGDDYQFLKEQLKEERELHCKKISDLCAKHNNEIKKLIDEINTSKKEISHLEQQKEEISKTVKLLSESSNTMSEKILCCNNAKIFVKHSCKKYIYVQITIFACTQLIATLLCNDIIVICVAKLEILSSQKHELELENSVLTEKLKVTLDELKDSRDEVLALSLSLFLLFL